MTALLQPLPPVFGPARERYGREVAPDYAAILETLQRRMTDILRGMAAADTLEELRTREGQLRRPYRRLSGLSWAILQVAAGEAEAGGGVGAVLDVLDAGSAAILDEARKRFPADDIAVVRFLLTTIRDAHRSIHALAGRRDNAKPQVLERLRRACGRVDIYIGLVTSLAAGALTLANPALLDPLLAEAKEHGLEYGAALAEALGPRRRKSRGSVPPSDAAEEIALAEADAADDILALLAY